jgi:hypothetical protein
MDDDPAELRRILKARRRGYAIMALEEVEALRHRTPEQDVRDFAKLMRFARAVEPDIPDVRAEAEESDWRERWAKVARRGV